MSNDNISLIETWVVELSLISYSILLKLSLSPIDGILSVKEMSISEIENILERVKLFKISEMYGFPWPKLTLKTTPKYMIAMNISTCFGLVNIATGLFMQVDLHCCSF